MTTKEDEKRKWILSQGFSEAEADSFLEFAVPDRKIEALAGVLHPPKPEPEPEPEAEPDHIDVPNDEPTGKPLGEPDPEVEPEKSPKKANK